MDRHLETLRFEPFWHAGLHFGRHLDIENPVAAVAVKMTMLLHIGAITCWAAFQGHLPGQTAFH